MLNPTQFCRCLGDDIRMALVCLLREHGEVCVCELTAALAAPQPTVSRHLAQLRECGLVIARREGTWMHYRLHPELPVWAKESIDTLAATAATHLDLQPLAKAC